MEQPETLSYRQSSPRNTSTGHHTSRSLPGPTPPSQNRSSYNNSNTTTSSSHRNGGSGTSRGTSSGNSTSNNPSSRRGDEYRSHSSSSREPLHDTGRRSSSSSGRIDRTERPPFLSTQGHRLRERYKLLEMNRFRNPIEDSNTLHHAVNVMGIDSRYLKDTTNPTMTPRIGIPGIFPTLPENEEEKYHYYAKRRIAYVSALPRGLGPMPTNWHKQYGFFSESTPLFNRLSTLLTQELPMQTIKKKRSPDTFVDYLVRQVRRFDSNSWHLWMNELSRRRCTIPELIQTFGGIPFEQWRASPDSKCPLLDIVSKYNLGMIEATWYIRINVIYQELNEMRRDRDRRIGDWFYHSKRFQRRSFEWTEQLIKYLHLNVRLIFEENLLQKKNKKKNNNFNYILKLTEYQYQLNLLDKNCYFNGLLSLYQKSLLLSEKSIQNNNGEYWSILPLPFNELLNLILLIIRLLPNILKDSSITKLLVKITLNHFRLLVSDYNNIKKCVTNLYQERLIVGLCDILRDVLRFGSDHLVHMKEEVFKLWPPFSMTDEFYPGLTNDTKEFVLNELKEKFNDLLIRKSRISEYYSMISRKRGKEIQLIDKKFRNEVDIIQILDEFHGGKSKLDVCDVYKQIFTDNSSNSIDELAIKTICEWAVTIYRSQEYKYISAAYLLEMKNDILLTSLKNKNIHEAKLQGILTSFLTSYEPKYGIELTSIIDFFSLLIRRRLFSFECFIEYVGCIIPERDFKPSPLLTQSKFQFEYGPLKGGFNIDGISKIPGDGLMKLNMEDRLRLYLWQFPRDNNDIPMENIIDNEDYIRNTWMELVQVKKNEIKRSRGLERVMILIIQIFQIIPDEIILSSELDQMAKIVELYSLIKKLTSNDKRKLSIWFLNHIYNISSLFFILNELNNMEHIIKLICFLLELIDIFSLLEILIHFLRHAPVYFIKTIIIPILDRHQMTFYACQNILEFIQAFEYRVLNFNKLGMDPDDKYQTIAMFICRIYQNNSKTLDKALKELNLHSPPEVLMKAFFAILKEDKLKENKEINLEGVNHKCAFPKEKDLIGIEIQELMKNVFLLLEKKYKNEIIFTKIMGKIDKNEINSRDRGVEEAVNIILNYGTLTSQQKIFMFRSFLCEIMEKWMNILDIGIKKANNNGNTSQQSIYILIPQYIHRCVRVLRDVIDNHDENERKLIRDTLLTWLNREVIVAFNGTEPIGRGQVEKPKNKHLFLPKFENLGNIGKDAYAANLKGHLDKIQYGLKIFLITLVIHGIVDLTQILRFVLIPGFPKKNAAAVAQRPEIRTLSNQILSMTLAFHLLGESPPQFVKLAPNIFANFEDPMIKYYWRHLRSMVPCCVMFPFLFLLCQMSYHWSLENNSLMPRQERGALASTILFDCTNDILIREIIFSDKEVRERHILKDNENIWYMSVIMKLLYRDINTIPEISINRIKLLKGEEIFKKMNKWMIYRGGNIYFEIEMIRQHLKIIKKNKNKNNIKYNLLFPLSNKIILLNEIQNNILNNNNIIQINQEDILNTNDKICIFIINSLFKKTILPSFYQPYKNINCSIEIILKKQNQNDIEISNLYASILCSIGSNQIAISLITGIVSRILNILQEEINITNEDQYINTYNSKMITIFLRQILTWNGISNNLYLRYIRSIKKQLELLLKDAMDSNDIIRSPTYLAVLKRKIAIRLQLVCITASVTNYTLPYRNGIVKILFSLLGTNVVKDCLVLFTWIIDIIPLIPSTIFTDICHEELIQGLKLPAHLAQRVYAVFPKVQFTAKPIYIGTDVVDPWALLEGITDLPCKNILSKEIDYPSKRQRIIKAI